jgi:hypothetical protein
MDTGIDQQHESDAHLANDFVHGAKSLAECLTSLGFPVSETDIYYLHRAKKWPFHKYGAFLIGSKRELASHARNFIRGRPAADQYKLNTEGE